MTTTLEIAHVAPLRLSSKPPTAKIRSMAAARLSLLPASSREALFLESREDKRPHRERRERRETSTARMDAASSDDAREKTDRRIKKRNNKQTLGVGVCPGCGFELPLTPASSPTDLAALPALPADGSSDGWSVSGSTGTPIGDFVESPGCAPPPPSPPPQQPPPQTFDAALADAHRRIAELEAQVQLLSQKATAAVDRCADYEDEITQLREQTRLDQELREAEERRRQQQQQQLQASPSIGSLARQSTGSGAPLSPAPSRSSFFSSSLSPNRLTALLSPRRSSGPDPPTSPPASRHQSKSFGLVPPPRTPPPPEPLNGLHSSMLPPSPSLSASAEMELLEALTREQTLRHAAEGRLSATTKEVEELSSALFEQANEMVAQERRARARLEERVMVLEKRDQDKRKRLERLESAMARIEKAREMLGTAAAEPHRWLQHR